MTTWFKEIPKNEKGKDWIVGDIHGQYDALILALKHINFDKSKDRLFSVGDLVDRGPKVFDCLRLLKEPWFFAVKGNHENMFLTKFGKAGWLHPLDLIRAYLYGDSHAIKALVSVSEMQELMKLIKDLPLVLKVNNEDLPFWIVHAQRPMKKNIIWTDEDLLQKGKVRFYDKDVLKVTWNRKILKDLGKKNKLILPYNKTSPFEIISNLPKYNMEDNVGLTYSGHTVLNEVIMHRSHIFIDGGLYKGGILRLIDHSLLIKDMNLTKKS